MHTAIRLVLTLLIVGTAAGATAEELTHEQIWKRIAPAFELPAEFADDETYPSPLVFADGRPVRTAEDWQQRRQEILATWHKLMGPWPQVITGQKLEVLKQEQRDGFTQQKVRFKITPDRTIEGYLQVPQGKGPFPAALVVYYDAETGAGLGKELRDFGYQLARRRFVTLSIGLGASLYHPNKENARLQPLSALAYAAANSYHVLAELPQVNPQRVGVLGHSYGGKWAMFASCLYDKFACAAWSDGGVVFDEKRANVNYWEPWYLGYDRRATRKPGIPTAENPRTGAYKQMIEAKRDLHELHALMAPRPFLVSGGSEDRPERWTALKHAIAVNKLLGHKYRVAMTNRRGHAPTEESNEQIYLFFEYFLKPAEK